MRTVAAVSAALLATAAAAAFDPDSWLERRELLTREAERLEKLYAKCAEKADNPAEKVSLPIDTFPSGAVKSLVTAEKAQFVTRLALMDWPWIPRIPPTELFP